MERPDGIGRVDKGDLKGSTTPYRFFSAHEKGSSLSAQEPMPILRLPHKER